MLNSSVTNQELIRRFELLESERENQEWVWDLIERWVLPGRGRFFLEGLDQENSIEFRHPELFDNTGVQSAQNLAASMHSGITNPATRWANFRFRQEQLNKLKIANDWLEECSQLVWLSLQNSNFNLSAGELYLDNVGFGTAVMFHEEQYAPLDTFGGHMFRTAMMREAFFELDWDGKPLSFWRKKAYTPDQIIAKFGEANVPDRVKDMAKNQDKATEKLEVIQVVYRRSDKQGADISGILSDDNRPVGCRYFLREGKETVKQDVAGQSMEETGYYEMPGYVVRFNKTAGSKFGHSPAINSLGDIRTLQRYVELSLKAGEKAVDPTMLALSRGVLSDIDLEAGGVTVVRKMDALQALESKARFDVSEAQMDALRRRIERAFFVDQLELKESPAMTATEVNARLQLMQRLLGPSLSRLTSDWLDPLLQRSFWMMYRKGALPEFPPELQMESVELDIEYIGTLPRSQRMEDVEATTRWVAMVGEVAGVKPEVLDVIDEDALAKTMADRLGVPGDVIRGEQDVAALRKQRADQQAAQEQLMQAGAEAEVMNSQANAQKTQLSLVE